MMCVYCYSIKLENRLQTVTTVERYVTLLTYVTQLLTQSRDSGAVDSALTAAVKDKRKTQNLTRVTVTLRYQTLPADSDRNRYITHTRALIGN